MYENYNQLTEFINRQYANNPVYQFGTLCYTQEQFRQYITTWYAWYQGYLEDVHSYQIYNGRNYTQVDRKTLKMAKKICEDKADLLANEKLEIISDDENANSIITDILYKNRFRSKFNVLLEKTQALGTGALIEFAENDEVKIDYITADKVIPLTLENGEVQSCAFASVTTNKDEECVYINAHIYCKPLPPNCSEETKKARMEMGIPADYEGYIIENIDAYYNRKTNSYECKDNVMPITLTYTKQPFFQIIRPAKANNFCFEENGLGVSCYSNAIDDLCACDYVYDSYVNEFNLGRKRIFVHDSMASVEVEDGYMKPVFDTKDVVFTAIDMEEDTNKIKEIDFNLRINEHEQGLNRMMNVVGFKCGLGNNYYKFQQGTVKTATEVISENNPLYRGLVKEQQILKDALCSMANALLVLYSQNPMLDNVEFNVNFDDSILEDTNAKRTTAMLEMSAGIIDKVQYFIDVYGYTEEQAIEKCKKISERMQAEMPEDTEVME